MTHPKRGTAPPMPGGAALKLSSASFRMSKEYTPPVAHGQDLQHASPLADARLCHLIRHLHGLGPRPVAECLVQVADPVTLMAALEGYARLHPHDVHTLGADALPEPGLWEVSE